MGKIIEEEMEEQEYSATVEAEKELWEAEHTKCCTKCGGQMRDEFPNGAGVLEEVDWYCTKCDYKEE